MILSTTGYYFSSQSLHPITNVLSLNIAILFIYNANHPSPIILHYFVWMSKLKKLQILNNNICCQIYIIYNIQ